MLHFSQHGTYFWSLLSINVYNIGLIDGQALA